MTDIKSEYQDLLHELRLAFNAQFANELDSISERIVFNVVEELYEEVSAFKDEGKKLREQYAADDVSALEAHAEFLLLANPNKLRELIVKVSELPNEVTEGLMKQIKWLSSDNFAGELFARYTLPANVINSIFVNSVKNCFGEFAVVQQHADAISEYLESSKQDVKDSKPGLLGHAVSLVAGKVVGVVGGAMGVVTSISTARRARRQLLDEFIDTKAVNRIWPRIDNQLDQYQRLLEEVSDNLHKLKFEFKHMVLNIAGGMLLRVHSDLSPMGTLISHINFKNEKVEYNLDHSETESVLNIQREYHYLLEEKHLNNEWGLLYKNAVDAIEFSCLNPARKYVICERSKRSIFLEFIKYRALALAHMIQDCEEPQVANKLVFQLLLGSEYSFLSNAKREGETVNLDEQLVKDSVAYLLLTEKDSAANIKLLHENWVRREESNQMLKGELFPESVLDLLSFVSNYPERPNFPRHKLKTILFYQRMHKLSRQLGYSNKYFVNWRNFCKKEYFRRVGYKLIVCGLLLAYLGVMYVLA